MLKVSISGPAAEWVRAEAAEDGQSVDEYLNGFLEALMASKVALSKLEQDVLDVIKIMAGVGGAVGALAVITRFASYPSGEVWKAIDTLKARGFIEDAGGRAALRPL